VMSSVGFQEGKSSEGLKVQGRSCLKMVGRHMAEKNVEGRGRLAGYLRPRALRSWIWKSSVGRCCVLIHVEGPQKVHGRSALLKLVSLSRQWGL
jgi:hypothetical protein